MSFGDFVRRTNSWHWLCAAVALSAIGSVHVPNCGWRDVLAYRRTALDPRIRNAKATLDGLRALDETEALSANKKAAELKAKTERLRRDFASYGLEPIPVGEDAVFAAQSRVSEALSRHRIRIVSNGASVAGEEVASAPSKGMQKTASAPSANPQMTAAEYRRQVDAQAAKMPDRAVREMFLADARRQIARLEQAERKKSPSSPDRAVAQRPQKPSVAPAFRTSEIGYRAAGDFRDVFMFLVGETHGKSAYSLKDIAVRRGEDGMDFSFTMRVQHR